MYLFIINYLILYFIIVIMAESIDLSADSILNWLNIETQNDVGGTKYVNKVENVSLRWNNLKITVTTRRSFWDYVMGYIFFIMSCAVVFLIPLCFILISWLNITDLFSGVRDTLVDKTNVSFGLWSGLNSLMGKTDVVDEYVWMMDDLLKK